MVTTLGVVEVQPAVESLSLKSPLAGIARRRFGGKTLLEWVVRRVGDAQRLSQIVVVAGDDLLTRTLAELAPADVRTYVSRAEDPLGRLADVAREFQPDAVVRLSVSTPFVDPVLLDRLITVGINDDECDYVGYRFGDGRPAVESKMGVFSEWCRTKAILRADREARHAEDRQHPTRYLHGHGEKFTLRFLPAPAKLDRDDLCLAIHDEEDWEHVELILDALGPESLDWQYIMALLDRHPYLARAVEQHRTATALL
ncbi:MAG TPA: NTP transferase domain-containing protein [Pirellulaceae bacterium]|nr:NTP transferase domain-containing protein [Pirellulaceae bacterium]